MSVFQVGYAEVNINPPLGIGIAGYYVPRFAKGYLEEMREELTEKEIELLPESAAILTYECGIRFLTDYLNGDTYFKVKRENHNLDRARNQFKLVADIVQKMDELKNRKTLTLVLCLVLVSVFTLTIAYAANFEFFQGWLVYEKK